MPYKKDLEAAEWIKTQCKIRNWSSNKLAKLIGVDPTVLTRNIWVHGVKLSLLQRCEDVFGEPFVASELKYLEKDFISAKLNRRFKADEVDVVVKSKMFLPCEITKRFKSHAALRLVGCYKELTPGDLVQVLDSQGKHKIVLCSQVEEGAERGRFGFWASSENPYDIKVVDFKRCKILAIVIGHIDLE
jgi:hypothetical protein